VVDYEVLDREDDYACLLLRGELTGDISSGRLKAELERHYVDDGVRTIRVVLEDLDFITLDGIGVLLELREESLARGKRFVLGDVGGQVRDKLQRTGLLDPLSEA
jgi:anti-anti-sigma factor